MSLKKVHFSEKTALRIVNGAQEGYIRTRDNHVVRLLCNDANGAYPIVGLIEREFGDVATQWTRQGKHDMRHNVKTPLDLIMFVPEEKGGEKMSLFGFGGKCEICGCTEDNPCYNPEHGFCGWADDERTICTHCAIDEIANDPRTIHRVNDGLVEKGGEQ